MKLKTLTIIFSLLFTMTSCESDSLLKAEDAIGKAEKMIQLVEAFIDDAKSIVSADSTLEKGMRTDEKTGQTNDTIMKYSPIIERNLTADERHAITYAMFPQGNWSGEKGESRYLPYDFNAMPRRGLYSNMRNLTWREILKENGCESGVPYKDGEVDYEAIGCVFAKVVFEGDKGIGEFLRPKNGSYDRQFLHEAAYDRLAKQKGVSIDEVKVYKGDSEPVERLMERWNCTEQDVWKRCGNPNKRIRVFHECADGRTVILVPRELHDHLSHCGGVEMYDRALEKES